MTTPARLPLFRVVIDRGMTRQTLYVRARSAEDSLVASRMASHFAAFFLGPDISSCSPCKFGRILRSNSRRSG
jgi:hypothetical protein